MFMMSTAEKRERYDTKKNWRVNRCRWPTFAMTFWRARVHAAARPAPVEDFIEIALKGRRCHGCNCHFSTGAHAYNMSARVVIDRDPLDLQGAHQLAGKKHEKGEPKLQTYSSSRNHTTFFRTHYNL